MQTSPLLIYTSAHSLYCAKLRILLRHKQIAYREAPPPGGGGSPQYLSLVPSGNIPALQLADRVLTDSEAIAEYLEEAYPQVPMLPTDLRARALSRERSRFSDTRLEPALRLTFPHVTPETRSLEAITRAHAEMSKRLVALGEMLSRSTLNPDRLWIGDCGTAVTLWWIDLFDGRVVPPLHWPETVRAYQARIMRHAAVAEEWRHYEPQMLRYMDEKGT